jgi:hypothetical protein
MDSAHLDDLDAVLVDALKALDAVVDRDWQVPAAGLDWTVWETLEHLADDHFAYAGQIVVRTPQLDDYVPFDFHEARDGGPQSVVFAERAQGNAGLVRVLEACGGLLLAAVHRAGPEVRGWHPYGIADPAGFAAMGTVETLVHLHDVAGGLGFAWQPDEDVVRRTLDRLFPQAPAGQDPWPTMLWATGRGALPGRDRLDEWRWDSTVR